MTQRRRGPAMVTLALFAVLLTACAGLPMTGDVTVGLAREDVELPPDISQIAAEPLEGASPEQIVEGFLDAALTPTDGWQIAREFLSPELAETWRPSAGVTIDEGAAGREFNAEVVGEVDTAEKGDVRVLLEQIARVDEDGAYTELSG
ncbi:MAG: LpqB family beta-propeller domain-containing protein, partial [Microbacterium sp.]